MQVMMKTTTLVLLVVSALLVMDTEAWWTSRRVKVTCNKRGALRSADDLSDAEVTQLTADLVKNCPSLGFDPTVGLTKDAVDAAFQKNDADSNGALAGEELDNFSEAIDAYEVCKDLDKVARK
ncbi:uncharacterized protein [Littorina saxatilis]|uniref:EF-hand domain-containing protein n=1 Tax=Littorina saxatilis TaxID=31220 RepID=A0AAN9B939_9CAEN